MYGLKITPRDEFQVVRLMEPLDITIRPELGGYMELLQANLLPAPYVIVVDEEGALKGLPINQRVTNIWQRVTGGGTIVGNAIILKMEPDSCGNNQLKQLHDQDISYLRGFFTP